MTELQFLIDLLLNQKLNSTTKNLIADRIKEVESQMRPNQSIKQMPTMVTSRSTENNDDIKKIAMAPVPIPTESLAINRALGGEVITGNGTKGPRKF